MALPLTKKALDRDASITACSQFAVPQTDSAASAAAFPQSSKSGMLLARAAEISSGFSPSGVCDSRFAADWTRWRSPDCRFFRITARDSGVSGAVLFSSACAWAAFSPASRRAAIRFLASSIDLLARSCSATTCCSLMIS